MKVVAGEALLKKELTVSWHYKNAEQRRADELSWMNCFHS